MAFKTKKTDVLIIVITFLCIAIFAMVFTIMATKAYPADLDNIILGNTIKEVFTITDQTNTAINLTSYTVTMLLYETTSDTRPYMTFTYDNDDSYADKVNGKTVVTIYPYDYSSWFTEAWYKDASSTDSKLAYYGVSTNSDEYLNSTTNNFTMTFDTSDNLYLGSSSKFKWVETTLATNGVAGTLTWSYWNGTAWGALTTTNWDYGANNFLVSGRFYFTPPSNWAAKVLTEVSGRVWQSCYYIKATKGTTFTTAPKESKIIIGGIKAATYHIRRKSIDSTGLLQYIQSYDDKITFRTN